MADENKSSNAELVPATSNGGKPTFSKEYLTNGDRFSFLDKAILRIKLRDSKQYTIDEANKIIKDYKEAI